MFTGAMDRTEAEVERVIASVVEVPMHSNRVRHEVRGSSTP